MNKMTKNSIYGSTRPLDEFERIDDGTLDILKTKNKSYFHHPDTFGRHVPMLYTPAGDFQIHTGETNDTEYERIYVHRDEMSSDLYALLTVCGFAPYKQHMFDGVFVYTRGHPSNEEPPDLSGIAPVYEA